MREIEHLTFGMQTDYLLQPMSGCL